MSDAIELNADQRRRCSKCLGRLDGVDRIIERLSRCGVPCDPITAASTELRQNIQALMNEFGPQPISQQDVDRRRA